ncbi:EF-hand domain-containing protein 1 [Histomonas meleagridis]|uniref:EF-hand domain-containing protein 1 n=1 Tax=Histomonas meleagridis TaxID=135588 RepID=UPI003559F521|nr:EF-hand domain-containing protein 1 [Histomonas meleagridis]KAH0799934.1 EF-hand domain-containing protein 1 [Histomonas meleagridis]
MYCQPNLPGFTPHNLRRTDFRRGQYFTVSNNGLTTAKPPRQETLQKEVQEHSRHLTFSEIKYKTGELQDQENSNEFVPTPPALKSIVLRFYAYFKENIAESQEEEERVRYVKIYVYVEDNSIMIEESKVRNSGMEQGVLLRRMKVLNPNAEVYGTPYNLSDFNVGINIQIYGITYRIYSCDEFTEKYFKSIGRELGAFEEPPDDLYSIKRKLTERPTRVTHINTDKTHLRQFLDFDGKVLRFYVVWDDSKSLFGEKRKFILHYFLVDDTIEIRQVLPQNSGRDPVSQFLSKTKLKKPNSTEYYTDSDLYIGQKINVFGREFLIYDADKFTREFLDKKYGKKDWTQINVDGEQTNQQITTQIQIPPYNGWGNEEDSVGNCLSLHPKQPTKDIVKLIQKSNDILRFSARFKNPQMQDRDRKFVIAFYEADDTLAVFETVQRNSGFKGGKFLQKGKYKNVNAGNRYFQASDFFIGAEVVINYYCFVIDAADELAQELMEAEPDRFPKSDLFEIMAMIKRCYPDGITRLKPIFEQLDTDKDGLIPAQNVMKYLESEFGLQKQEVSTIMRRYSKNRWFDYKAFLLGLC